MIDELLQHMHEACRVLPRDHPRFLVLRLLREAIHRDIDVLDSHPTGLFQCLWNSCWWYDNHELMSHSEKSSAKTETAKPESRFTSTMAPLLEEWRASRHNALANPCWFRNLRPPPVSLGTGQMALLEVGGGFGFSPDGKEICTANGKSVDVWNAWTSRHICTLECATPSAADILYTEDGQQILMACSKNGRVFRWDARSRTSIPSLDTTFPDGIRALAASSNGSIIAAANRQGTIAVVNARTGSIEKRFIAREGRHSLALSDEGRTLVSLSSPAFDIDLGPTNLCIWDVVCGRLIREEQITGPTVPSSMALSRNGMALAYSHFNIINVYDFMHDRKIQCLPGHKSEITSVAFSADGKQVASGSGDHHSMQDYSVRLSCALSGKLLSVYRGHGDNIVNLKFSTHGNRLASSGIFDPMRPGGCVRVWDLQCTPKPWPEIIRHNSLMECVCFSPCGRMIVSGDGEGRIMVWNTADARLLYQQRLHAGSVNCAAFSPDSSILATGAGEHDGAYWHCNAILWDARTGKRIHELKGHTKPVMCLAISRDGRILATGSMDHTVCIWQVDTGELRRQITGHSGIVRRVDISEDGSRLISNSYDYGGDMTWRLWDLASGIEMKRGTIDGNLCGFRHLGLATNRFAVKRVAPNDFLIECAQSGLPLERIGGMFTDIAVSPTEAKVAAWNSTTGYITLYCIEGSAWG